MGRYLLEKLWQDRSPAASVLPKGKIQLEGGYGGRIGLHGGDPSVRNEENTKTNRLDTVELLYQSHPELNGQAPESETYLLLSGSSSNSM